MVQCFFHNVVHVIIFILGKAPSEEDIFFFVGQCLVFLVKRIVPLVVDGVIRFAAFLPF